MDYVCIDRLQEEGLAAQTVAIYFDGEFEDNLTYKNILAWEMTVKGIRRF